MTAILMLFAIVYQGNAQGDDCEYEGDGIDIILNEEEQEERVDSDEIDTCFNLGIFDELELECETETEGGYQGITPMFGRPEALVLTAYCYYTSVQLTRNIGVPVTWDPPSPDTTPGPFTISFPTELIPPPPSGWNLQGAYIRVYFYDMENPLNIIRIMEPFVIDGERAYFEFPFEFTQWGRWHVLPVFELFWRPDHPPIVKEASPVYPATLPVFIGDIVEYTITIRNPAVNPLLLHPAPPPWRLTTFDGFRMVDDLPEELSLIAGSVSVAGGTEVVDNSDIANSIIDITFNLPGYNEPGHPVVITFRATVTEEALQADEIINIAYLYNPNTDEPVFDDEIIPVADPPIRPPVEEPPSQDPPEEPPSQDPPEEPPSQPPTEAPPSRAPLTGDNMNMLLYILLAQFSVASTLAVSSVKRRGKV